ncbi:MAG TPA: hypothetical protein PK147_06190 [Saprospiraceae bacterium]|nr:hypothetical protein [Saprospiraceae bacterium]HPQ21420.1 hypothetical protein [Saprospiraceae bacterium]
MSKLFIFNIVSLAFILIISAVILFPLFPLFPYLSFFVDNYLVWIVFLILVKDIFFTKFSFYANTIIPKVILIVLMIPLFLYLIDKLYDFQSFLDEEGLQLSLLNEDFSYSEISFWEKYLRLEYLFALVGGLVSTIVFPIKLIYSIWVKINKNKNV